jgi:CRP-like cAMP-binding protein
MVNPRLRLPVELLGSQPSDVRVREAAWVARCVGRGDLAPLTADDITALADTLESRTLKPGQVLFSAGMSARIVWIIRSGHVELAVGSGRRRVIVQVLHPGDVDGDIHFLLGMPAPYTARALDDAACLVLSGEALESLLQHRPAIARRWLSSVAARLARSQARILKLLGQTLSQQVAQLLLDEGHDGEVPFRSARWRPCSECSGLRSTRSSRNSRNVA